MLKGKNLLILVLVGIGVYMLWKRSKASTAATTAVPSAESTKEGQIAAMIQSDTAVA